jgi:pilus assembly protein CpaE
LKPLRVVLAGPDERRRRAVAEALTMPHATVVREYSSYPGIAQLNPGGGGWDVAMVDLDSDQAQALSLVEAISRNSAATVMVYSGSTDPELLMKCMWAGAREYLNLPLSQRALAEALTRAAARLLENNASGKSGGKVLLFMGAKGGAGVTTIAANFLVALRKQTSDEAVLLDLDAELGDASVVLGIKPNFTIADALQNSTRLDAEFVSGMLARHQSGAAVIAGPDRCDPSVSWANADLTRLLCILRDQFAYVVVDAGASLGKNAETLVEFADSIYLVSQVDMLGLRNAQRYIAYFQRLGAERLEVVLNRYDPRRNEINEAQIVKFLGAGVAWKLPNDYTGVRHSHNTGAPLTAGNSPISRILHQMAQTACGKSEASANGRKRAFGLFGAYEESA